MRLPSLPRRGTSRFRKPPAAGGWTPISAAVRTPRVRTAA